MTIKIRLFSMLILGITTNSGLAMKPLNDKDLSDLVEKGFIIRKDCSKEIVPCFSEEYHEQILLPEQQKIAAEFPNMPPRVAFSTAIMLQDIKYLRSQSRNVSRKLVDVNYYDDRILTPVDVKKMELDLHKDCPFFKAISKK